MPVFEMEARYQCQKEESPFVLGFIEAMFFTEQAQGTTSEEWWNEETQADLTEGRLDGCIPGDMGFADIHPDSLDAIRADCEAWQEANAAILALAYEQDGYGEEEAGRDYWFTRNGHGVGFWDRDPLKSNPADREVYEALTDEMIAANERGDKAAWGAALDKRKALEAQSIGERLSAACRYRDVNAFFGDHVTHGRAPFVHVDI